MRFNTAASFVVLALAAVAFANPSPCPQFCVECEDGSWACACEHQTCPPSKRSLEEGLVKRCPQYCIECDNGETLCACAALKGCPA
ncbi:hypothetical protein EXIGLDRAFT_769054 [Exidia glandulosa HHB12029]|uniref:Uncharacterized protein n=1 Tax=Exidia glandulosa HHB12029 TaxID=1314781 RepID=A0A165HSI0_EXIGL|nr:hypothetical protein EXIGLDRAFT_769054 [Exidia glandulosa HHB12029]